MSKIIYFVVGVDLEAEEAFIDDDTFMARFGKDEQVWNETTLQWEPDTTGLYQYALNILNNKPLKKD